MYLDKLGLIVQASGDGGDSLARLGFYHLPRILQGSAIESDLYLEALDKHWTSEGPTRHPTQYPSQSEVSRDQLTPNIVVLGVIKQEKKLWFIFNKIIRNWFRYPNNTDVASPEHIGHFLRGFMMIRDVWLLFYPILFFSDLFMLLGVIVRCIQAKNPDNVGDDLNTLVSVVQAQYTIPTPISWLARKTYVKLRPKPHLTKNHSNTNNNIYSALLWYFREESGANPEIAHEWQDICNNL